MMAALDSSSEIAVPARYKVPGGAWSCGSRNRVVSSDWKGTTMSETMDQIRLLRTRLSHIGEELGLDMQNFMIVPSDGERS